MEFKIIVESPHKDENISMEKSELLEKIKDSFIGKGFRTTQRNKSWIIKDIK